MPIRSRRTPLPTTARLDRNLQRLVAMAREDWDSALLYVAVFRDMHRDVRAIWQIDGIEVAVRPGGLRTVYPYVRVTNTARVNPCVDGSALDRTASGGCLAAPPAVAWGSLHRAPAER